MPSNTKLKNYYVGDDIRKRKKKKKKNKNDKIEMYR